MPPPITGFAAVDKLDKLMRIEIDNDINNDKNLDAIDTNNDIEENFYYKLFWYFCHIIEIFGIAYSICRLRYNLNFYKHSRQIKDEYKISRELFIISIIWFFFDIANYIIFFIFKFTILGEYQYIIFEFVRNFCMILVSGLFPLMISFNSLNLPICTTKECASNFNLLLITEKTYDSFMKMPGCKWILDPNFRQAFNYKDSTYLQCYNGEIPNQSYSAQQV